MQFTQSGICKVLLISCLTADKLAFSTSTFGFNSSKVLLSFSSSSLVLFITVTHIKNKMYLKSMDSLMLQRWVNEQRFDHREFPKERGYFITWWVNAYIPWAISVMELNAGSRGLLRPFWINLPSRGPISMRQTGIQCEIKRKTNGSKMWQHSWLQSLDNYIKCYKKGKKISPCILNLSAIFVTFNGFASINLWTLS